MDDRKKNVSRRGLLKAAGAGLAGAAAVYGLNKLGLLPGTSSPVPEPPADGMTYRTHPQSGDRVSLLGFGCMRLPVRPEATSPRGPEVDEAATFALVDYALDHGVNYFDTAWGYHGGMSETVIGKALKRHPRERFHLSTKMPTYLDPDLAMAKDIFARQLEKCQVEYFDYYLLHTLTSKQEYQRVYEERGILDFLLEQREKGRIRHLGWSFHGDKETLEYVLSRDVRWDFALVQLNYHDLLYKHIPSVVQRRRVKEPAPARWMFDRMQESGLPLMVMEPLLGGRLARLNKKALTILQAADPQASAASWAFRYVAGLPNVMTVLSGMTYMEHLQDNLRTFAPLRPCSDRELAVLEEALAAFATAENIQCTTCGYCMPCPYGVDIPTVFLNHNHCLDDEQVPRGERDADYDRARRAYLVNLARRVPDLRDAAHCTGCGKCVKLCPQFIDIPGEMARLGKFAEDLRIKG